MPTVIFIEHNGTEHRVQAESGVSVMQAAILNNVPGIIADCGGNCACATCHVYVDAAWRARTGTASKNEAEMIDCALHVQEGSRLSCQIHLSAELDGVVVRLPESQTECGGAEFAGAGPRARARRESRNQYCGGAERNRRAGSIGGGRTVGRILARELRIARECGNGPAQGL